MLFNYLEKSVCCLLLTAVLFCAAKAAGEIDTTFKASAYANDANSVNKALALPDGKILVVGRFTAVNGVAREGIVRLNQDGSVDSQFTPPPFYDYSVGRTGGAITNLALQSNGKIIVVGIFSLGNNIRRDIVRLNADGTLDESFADLTSQFQTSNEYIADIKIGSDDTINIVGTFVLDSYGLANIAKLNADGTINTSSQFQSANNSLFSVAIQPDGKVIAAGSINKVIRYSPNGSLDGSFTSSTINDYISKILVQPDNKIIVAGSFNNINGFAQGRISRLNADGSIDTTFNPNGIGADAGIADAVLGADGKILIAGGFTKYNNVSKPRVARLNADGTLDTSFTLDSTVAALNLPISSVALQNDGKVLITITNTPTFNGSVYRLNADGTLDATFTRPNFGRGGFVYDIVQQPDGKILAAGYIFFANGVSRYNIARYNLDGSLDTGFNADVRISSQFIKIGVQASGKILLVAQQNSGVQRLNADGSNDASFIQPAVNLFGGGDIKALPDGKFLLSQARYLESGGIDASYTIPTLNDKVLANKALADGKYLIGGSFTQVNGMARGRIARLNNSGTLDTTFNPPLGANGDVLDLDVQSDGKVIIVGSFSGLNGATRNFIGRLNTDGSLDTNFNPLLNGQIRSIKVQADNKILIAGDFTAVNGVSREHYARLNADGSLDTTFIVDESGIPFQLFYKITTQADGKILLGGYINRIRKFPVVNIARLLNNTSSRPLFDFDGDGRADVSLFRPSNGTWYVLPSQSGNFYGQQFGIASDKLAPADYDGDGKTDLAVFRENISGQGGKAYFYILNSSNGLFRAFQFGADGDLPISGDWDGDGIADIAVYRDGSRTGNGQSYFYYRPSSQPTIDYRELNLGAAGDVPVAGDFDGDGKRDAAVFRPSTAQWSVLRSSNVQTFTVQFGISTDIPTPADFNGDGVTDVAVFRPSNGYWYYSSSQTNPSVNFTGIQFGTNGDVPAPADYDGDGKADVAVFRPSSGIWYVNRTTQGFYGVQFGASQDKPAPNAFIR